MSSAKSLHVILASMILLLLQDPAPAQATTTALTEVICPLTGEPFQARVYNSWYVAERRLDTRPVLAGGPQSLPLPTCPDSGFPVYRDDFSAEEMNEIRKLVSSAEFSKIRQTGNTYHAAAFIEERLGGNHESVAWLYLRASWVAEDHNQELFTTYLTLSLLHFRSYLSARTNQDDNWWTAQLTAANLERRIWNFDKAIERVEALPKEHLSQDSVFHSFVEQILLHARNGDAGPKSLVR